MEQEVNMKTTCIAIQSSERAGEAFVRGLQGFVNQQRQNISKVEHHVKSNTKNNREVTGKMVKVKDLRKDGSQVEFVDIGTDEMKEFRKFARKYKDCIRYGNRIMSKTELLDLYNDFILSYNGKYKKEIDTNRLLLHDLQSICKRRFLFLSRKVDSDLEALLDLTLKTIKEEKDKKSISNEVINSIIYNISILMNASFFNYDKTKKIVCIGDYKSDLYKCADQINTALKDVRKTYGMKKKRNNVKDILSPKRLFIRHYSSVADVVANEAVINSLNRSIFELEHLTYAFYIAALRDQELKEEEGLGW